VSSCRRPDFGPVLVKTAYGFGGLAYASDGVTSGCRSLVEGIMKLILRFKVLVVISSPQTAPLGGLASGKLLSQCLAVHPLIFLVS
jgi:hypothetical protein